MPNINLNLPFSSGVNVQDEGIFQAFDRTLNFVGTGVTVTQGPTGTANINIPGGSGTPTNSFVFMQPITGTTPTATTPTDTLTFISSLGNISIFGDSTTDTLDFNVVTGNLTDVGTDGIVITGGTGAVIGAGTSIAQHVADATHNGYLSSTDWSTFNSKQPAGNYITALTGDVTATGPGSVPATLATVNASPGTFAFATITVNGKGLVTAASANTPVTSVALALPVSVFTVSGSPVTSTGTLTGSFNTQSANTVFAGPTTGAAAVPTFRALVSADIPTWTVSSKNANFTAATQNIYLITTSGGAISVQLPAPVSGLIFTLKDATGTAETNNITVVRAAAEMIEGIAASKLLTTNWGGWTIVSDGTNWFMI